MQDSGTMMGHIPSKLEVALEPIFSHPVNHGIASHPTCGLHASPLRAVPDYSPSINLLAHLHKSCYAS